MVSSIITKNYKEENILDLVTNFDKDKEDNKRKEMLNLRKKLIMKAEKEFIEKLGLQYES